MSADSASVNLTNHFLIAMPGVDDAIFSKSVVFVCEHSPRGALGLVINKPADMDLKALFEKIDLPLQRADLQASRVFQGGPVQTERGFVLHQPLGSWQSSLAISDELGMTTSKDILQAVAEGQGPERFFITLGYAGWSAGQLESELAQNAWLTVEADPNVIFNLPAEQRYEAALKLLGIDMAMLSDEAGHA